MSRSSISFLDNEKFEGKYESHTDKIVIRTADIEIKIPWKSLGIFTAALLDSKAKKARILEICRTAKKS